MSVDMSKADGDEIVGATLKGQVLAAPAEPASGPAPSGLYPSRIKTRQLGRSWWSAYDEKGAYLATGKTARDAKELALQKHAHGDDRRGANSLPDVSARDLGAPAPGLAEVIAARAAIAKATSLRPVGDA